MRFKGFRFSIFLVLLALACSKTASPPPAAGGPGASNAPCNPGDACPSGETCDLNFPAGSKAGQCFHSCPSSGSCANNFVCNPISGACENNCNLSEGEICRSVAGAVCSTQGYCIVPFQSTCPNNFSESSGLCKFSSTDGCSGQFQGQQLTSDLVSGTCDIPCTSDDNCSTPISYLQAGQTVTINFACSQVSGTCKPSCGNGVVCSNQSATCYVPKNSVNSIGTCEKTCSIGQVSCDFAGSVTGTCSSVEAQSSLVNICEISCSTTSSTCPAGLTCLAGNNPPQGTCRFAGCSQQSDCPTEGNYTCFEGRCELACVDANCPSGETCEKNQCQKPQACGASVLCPTGSSCVSGACTHSACSSTVPCPDSFSCIGGFCQSSHCGDGYVGSGETCDEGTIGKTCPNCPNGWGCPTGATLCVPLKANGTPDTNCAQTNSCKGNGQPGHCSNHCTEVCAAFVDYGSSGTGENFNNTVGSIASALTVLSAPHPTSTQTCPTSALASPNYWMPAPATGKDNRGSICPCGYGIWVENGVSTTAETLPIPLTTPIAIYGGFSGTEQTIYDRTDNLIASPAPGQTNPAPLGRAGFSGTILGNSTGSTFLLGTAGAASPPTVSIIIDGFQLQNGADSAVVVNSNANAILRNLRIVGNQTAADGGAIRNAGVMTLQDSYISRNSASTQGGAISHTSSSGTTSTIERVVFYGNGFSKVPYVWPLCGIGNQSRCPQGMICPTGGGACFGIPACNTGGSCPIGMTCPAAGGACTPVCSAGGSCPTGMLCPQGGGDCTAPCVNGSCPVGMTCPTSGGNCTINPVCTPGGNNCPFGTYCPSEGGVCVATPSCLKDGSCPDGMTCPANGGTCYYTCNNNGSCPGGMTCPAGGGTCAYTCTSEGSCPLGLTCPAAGGVCTYTCNINTDCPSGMNCVSTSSGKTCQVPSTALCAAGGTCSDELTCPIQGGNCIRPYPIGQLQNGGAVASTGSAPLQIFASKFNANQAFMNGGGIYTNSQTLTVVSSVLAANRASYGGGGIYLAKPSGSTNNVLMNNTYIGNAGLNRGGGGVFDEGTNSSLSNSLFRDNIGLFALVNSGVNEWLGDRGTNWQSQINSISPAIQYTSPSQSPAVGNPGLAVSYVDMCPTIAYTSDGTGLCSGTGICGTATVNNSGTITFNTNASANQCTTAEFIDCASPTYSNCAPVTASKITGGPLPTTYPLDFAGNVWTTAVEGAFQPQPQSYRAPLGHLWSDKICE